MKTALCYFSGTGNTFDVAKRISNQLEDAELIFLFHATKAKLMAFERIGFLFPAYMFGAPAVVLDFIEQLEIPSGKELFSIVVSGGMPAISAHQLQAILKKKGLKLTSAMAVTMPDNYILMFPVNDENNRKTLSKANQKIVDIIACLQDRISVPLRFHPLAWLSFLQRRIGQFAKKTDHYFVVDGCSACGKCVDICPMDNITLENGSITYMGHCAGCLACLHVCPVQAINYGKKTQGKKRYFNPNIDPYSIKKGV